MDVLVGMCLFCLHAARSGLKVKKMFSCSTQQCMKFIMLINVKMPTIVGILTFMSSITTTSESLKVRRSLFSADFLMSSFNFMLS